MRYTLRRRPVITLWSGHVCRASAWTTRFFISSNPEIFLQMNGLTCRSCLISSCSTLASRSLLATLASAPPAGGVPTSAAGAPAWLRLRQRVGCAPAGPHPPRVHPHLLAVPNCKSCLDGRQAGGVSTTRRSSERLQKFDKIGFLPGCEIQLEQLIIVVDHRHEIRRTAVVEVWRMLPESS
jgi:hypothetical protein